MQERVRVPQLPLLMMKHVISDVQAGTDVSVTSRAIPKRAGKKPANVSG